MKQNIRVNRYRAEDEKIPGACCADGTFPWLASVEPEDGAWVLFVPKDPTEPPQLWLRVEGAELEPGTGEAVYAPAASGGA